MRLQTSADVGRVWLASLSVFAGSVVVVRALGHDGSPMPGLWIGYVGLLALVIATVLTTRWTFRVGPASAAGRFALYAGLTVAYLFLLVALVFPFL